MYSKSLIALVVTFLSLSLQVSAHAIISPALGVNGTPVRNDVQRPSQNAECGNVNIANTINTSGSVPLSSTGTFNANITNFNSGVDGSRQVTALVDPTGTGKSFQSANVTKNGDENPTNVGSQELTVQLPKGVQCSGGSGENLCLVSFTTAGGFGNCIAVKQTTDAATGATSAKASTSAAAATSAKASTFTAAAKTSAVGVAAAQPSATGSCAAANAKSKGKRDSRAVGSRAARVVRAAADASNE